MIGGQFRVDSNAKRDMSRIIPRRDPERGAFYWRASHTLGRATRNGGATPGGTALIHDAGIAPGYGGVTGRRCDGKLGARSPRHSRRRIVQCQARQRG